MTRQFLAMRTIPALALFIGIWSFMNNTANASDHLDSPTVIANPQADIADVYAWTSPVGRQLNLVMTIFGQTFSEKVRYVFHVDSGKQFGKTTATTTISCRFTSAGVVECKAGNVDIAKGDASHPEGIQGRNRRFRVFAGLRDDPFFNNVRGTRAAYQVALDAVRNGAEFDEAVCPGFSAETSARILDQWRHTDGGPAKNFLAGWAVSAIVISIDFDVVNKGGNLLGVWGTTSMGDKQIDRAARPLTGNALLGTIAPEEVSNALKEQYNAATPATSAKFIPEIQKGLGLYDSFDGQCGNQLLANKSEKSSQRYRAMATLLADDRIWVNSESKSCSQFFAVELSQLAGRKDLKDDCGGRTPLYNASNIYRSLLVDGSTNGVDDGIVRDEREHSASVFPFLAAPETK